MQEIISIIARELNIPIRFVSNTLDLLEGGATVPFISRYRKEATGSLDEVKISSILDRMLELKEIQHRKKFVLNAIKESNNLTPEIQESLLKSWDINEIEDIYLPFKPKRKTRAESARQKGLEPLAKEIFRQDNHIPDFAKYLNNEVSDKSEALSGAKDIIAEWISENATCRNRLRQIFAKTAVISSKVVKGKESDGKKYRDYFDFSQSLQRCSSHRLLAIRRGESEGILKVAITPADYAEDKLKPIFLHGNSQKSAWVSEALHDSFTRLLKPSIENEFASISKRDADLDAIEVFATNLRSLLLSSPLGQCRVLAIDPGFRTGCKVVCLDSEGNLLHNMTIFPHGNEDNRVYAEMQLLKCVDQFDIEAIAIGSGTAGRETRDFIGDLGLDNSISIFMVNEDGASVYSASPVAREEFPDHDVTVRGAVSIGRRLMDPLSELVKIDPKSIGVGQYQHDVDQKLLKKKLDVVTESCVNLVGVNLNTASRQLLSYVSGLGASLASNIVEYRKQNGAFKSREELKNVPRLGAKAFEQSAAFLKIVDAENPLDNTAVHPERYNLVSRIAKNNKLTVRQLIEDKALRDSIDISSYIGSDVGVETLTDIMNELSKPGRDPRNRLKKFSFDETISSIEDLRQGMILPGIVSNVTNFGCFVDLGIKTKGLVHISQLNDKPVKNPHNLVKVQQQIMVKVLDIDLDRDRIALSMKGVTQQ